MKKDLFVCNTVYQVLVAMWIKHIDFPDSKADIIISDHMNGGEDICDRLKKVNIFESCYFCTTKSFSYGEYLKEFSDADTSLLIHRHPERFITRFFPNTSKYQRIFIANVDKFAQILFDACSRRVRNCRLYLFEDGLSTYTKTFESFYQSTKESTTDFLHHLVYKYVYNKKSIYGNVSGCYLFNPSLSDWTEELPLIEIKKINTDDKDFLNVCNYVFDYQDQDKYDTQYLFMEESFFADGIEINDCEIVEKIAQKVGKENIMVKIHPRNPVNRFKALGYKTNTNTSIPWELIIMNNPDVCNQVLVTITSASVLTPYLIFEEEPKVYSFYDLISKEVIKYSIFESPVYLFVKKLLENYSQVTFIKDYSIFD